MLAEGLINIFNHTGCVPHEIWFDNLSPAVKKILKGPERKLTDAFLRFKNHYSFAAAFCNAASGHEKGYVENKAGYHRRNFLVPMPRFDDLGTFNRELLLRCDEDMNRPHYKKKSLINELFAEDLKAMLPLPVTGYDHSEIKAVRTDSYAKFTLNNGKHTYSTAPQFSKKELFARQTAFKVILLDENYREILTHPRLCGETEQEQMDWLPYLTQLSRRPAALKYSGIYSLLPEPVQIFLTTCDYQVKKEALAVLAKLSETNDFDKAVRAIEMAQHYGVSNADNITAAFSRLNTEHLALDRIVLHSTVPQLPSVKSGVENYDRLFLKGGRAYES